MSAQTACTTQSPRSSRNHPGLPASLGFAVFLLVSAPALAQVLGTASNFAVLAGTPDVTNTGSTVVSGSVGVFPGSQIVGFPPGLIVAGTQHAADTIAQQAQFDNTAAFGFLTSRTPASILPALGGQTLTPGVYNTGGGVADLTGTLNLSGPGLYIIQTASLVTASGLGASIVNLNGASPCDLWWTSASSVSIGTGSAMAGNILALTSITIGTGATLQGRALAQNGTVTLASNAVTACSGGTAGPIPPGTGPVPPGFLVPPAAAGTTPTLGKAFNPATLNAGGGSTLTITLSNPDAAVSTLTAPLIDTLPSGVVIAATPNVVTTCTGVGAPVAIAGGSTVTLPAGRSIPANGSCTLTVNVTVAVGGPFINTLPAGALVTTTGMNAAPAAAAIGQDFGVPTLSEWAMVMLAALLAFAGFGAMRRRAR